jgi:hypothetical protein
MISIGWSRRLARNNSAARGHARRQRNETCRGTPFGDDGSREVVSPSRGPPRGAGLGNEKDRATNPVFQRHRRFPAPHKLSTDQCTPVADGVVTEMRCCVRSLSLRSSRTPRRCRVGDGFQPKHPRRSTHPAEIRIADSLVDRRLAPLRAGTNRFGATMSAGAIAAALALDGMSSGERLVAFSLASFANREQRAFPGAQAAAARAGLSRGRYLQARDQLVSRGLVIVEHAATGRNQSSTVRLPFAERGPWSQGEINPPLFEAALDYSTARGPARLLLASVAALADEEHVLADITTEELCRAAGLADKSYRRARHALLSSGELILLTSGGGRGKANRWKLPDPRQLATARRKPERARRVPPPAGARPLLTPVSRRDDATSHDSPMRVAVDLPRAVNPGQDRTLPPGNPGQDRTVLDPETPAQTPAQTPAPNARAGRNPRTPEPERHPPQPPSTRGELGRLAHNRGDLPH